ncbi:type 1 glutamine amidotransferase domain-containing protein [Nocardia halotolerans]|uniref:Type 1 glutamine amidotransferase domain-containing protein n=1 Tax=Nocardia halotolerans TaxID=1755878 RepID=A0ABV8VJ15_9NOCA
MAKILFVMTGADHWTLSSGAKHHTGYWADEFAAPYQVFTEAGHDVVVATPAAVVPPVDLGSLAPNANGGEAEANKVAEIIEGADPLAHPVPLADVRLDDFAAVYYPGGHGPMEDLAVNPDSAALLVETLNSGKPLALVCHGPAALLATAADGPSPFAGYRLTAFSDAEERLGGLADKAKWLLEDRLIELGADYRSGEPFAPFLESDRNLHTGQNPASAGPLASAVLDVL